ncbi:MAG: hypothetical protein JW719_07940 [Pirellulales bacterium]|nr:hypothetical protein [Pirellulales bacterium]
METFRESSWGLAVGWGILLGMCDLAMAQGSPPADAAATANEPEKMISVTIEYAKGGLVKVWPTLSPGVDVVNLGGMSADGQPRSNRLTFDCLPGAMVYLIAGPAEPDATNDAKPPAIGSPPVQREAELFLAIQPGDDRQTLKLRVDPPFVYANDKPVWMDVSAPKIEKKDVQKEDLAQLQKVYAEEVLEKLKNLNRTPAVWKRFGLHVELVADRAPVLEALKGAGVGVYLDTSSSEASEAAGDAFWQALAAVKPRQLMIGAGDLSRLPGEVSFVETLFLNVDSDGIPDDLSRFSHLRNLVLVGNKSTIDFAGVEKLTRLRAIGVFMAKCKNVDRLGRLDQLQYLSLLGDEDEPMIGAAVLAKLPRLQYLAAATPDGDLSFVAKMPHLRTLCIPVAKQQDFEPLTKLESLRCLAIGGGDADARESLESGSLKEFHQARPNVKIVPYQGICLGSFWLVPLAIGAAVVARVIRRRD